MELKDIKIFAFEHSCLRYILQFSQQIKSYIVHSSWLGAASKISPNMSLRPCSSPIIVIYKSRYLLNSVVNASKARKTWTDTLRREFLNIYVTHRHRRK